jgi:hypothetical protein
MRLPGELAVVVRRLGGLAEETVFVGGMIRQLLVTDPAAGPARPTRDVDCVVSVESRAEYEELSKKLRPLGFSECLDPEAPICRWVVEDVRVDIMPTDPSVFGFTNVWYPSAFVAMTIADLLVRASFVETLPGHLPGDEASQARLPVLIGRLERIAAAKGTEPIAPSAAAQPTGIVSWPQKTTPAVLPGRAALRSSNLTAASYDITRSVLSIEFHGGRVYEYDGVPRTVYAGLLGAASHGRYFHQWIRDRYPTVRIA